MPSTCASTTWPSPSPRPPKAVLGAMDELKNGVEEALQELLKAAEEGHSEGFLRFLELAGRFHSYSWRNQLLILRQRPEATLVAGYSTWKRLGRYVRQGEKGIAIWAPILKPQDPPAGEEGEREWTVVGFRRVYVFDISQTEGKPLRALPEVLGPEEAYRQVRQACPWPVVEADLPPMAYGRADGGRILVRRDLAPAEKAAVGLHEWAHHLLHFDGQRRSQALEELEAESVAYAVGRKLGLDMASSRDYIRAKAKDLVVLLREGKEAEGGENEAYAQLLERVAGAVRAIGERLWPKAEEALAA